MFFALFGPWITPYDPLATNAANALQPPSWHHVFGTDQLGRDVFSRVIAATRLDLGIATSAVALSFFFGCALGCSAGFWGGWIDRIVGRFSDTIMAFPLFVLAMGIVAAMGIQWRTSSTLRRSLTSRSMRGSPLETSVHRRADTFTPHASAAAAVSVFWQHRSFLTSYPQ